MWKSTDCGLIAEIIGYVYNFVEALDFLFHQLSTMKTLCCAHSGVLFSFSISFKCQLNLAFWLFEARFFFIFFIYLLYFITKNLTITFSSSHLGSSPGLSKINIFLCMLLIVFILKRTTKSIKLSEHCISFISLLRDSNLIIYDSLYSVEICIIHE